MPTRNINTDLKINGSIELDGILYDAGASAGTSGQVLSSTSTGTDWVTLSEISGVDGTGTANYLSKWLDANTITNSLVYDNGTNVGIGTTSPNGKLDVRQTANSGRTLVLGNTAASVAGDIDGQIVFTKHPAFYDSWKLYSKNTNAGNGQADLYLDSYATTSTFKNNVTFLNNGNVGIGTTSPNAQGLTIRREGSNEQTLLQLDRPNTVGLKTNIKFSVANIMVGKIQHEYAASNYNHMSFTLRSVGGADIIPLWLENSGNVGIGTTDPTQRLEVNGNVAVANSILVGGNYTNNSYSSVSSTRLLFGGGNDPNSYFIGTNLENYGGNYTKLDLRWHTGIRMGARQVYGGIRFFDSEFLGTVLFSIGKGDTNTRVESGNFLVSSGNVGIGTTNPTQKLHVSGNVDIDNGGILLQQGYGLNLGLSGYDIWMPTTTRVGIQTAATERLSILNNGNVGIGTTSPASKLHISDASVISMSSTGSGQFAITGNGYTAAMAMDNTALYLYHNSAVRNLVLGTNETARLTIKGSNGNIGVGTTAPQCFFHATSSAATNLISRLEQDHVDYQAWFQADSQDGKYINIGVSDNGDNYAFLNTSKGSLRFMMSSAIKMLITSSGNVGIGTNSPVNNSNRTTLGIQGVWGGQLDIMVGSAVHASFGTDNFSTGERCRIQSGTGMVFKVGADTTIKNAMRILTDGNIGIGTASPSAKLDVSVTPSAAGINLINGSETAFRLTSYNNGTNNGSNAYAFKHGLYHNTTENAAVTFYRGGSSTGGFLTFTTSAGNERMRIDSSGNVSIGTTNTYARLSVKTTSHNNGISVNRASDVTAAMYLGNDGGNNAVIASNNADLLFGRDLNGVFTRYMTMTNGGNVGIGTVSPQASLHVAGSIGTTPTGNGVLMGIYTSGASNYGHIQLNGDTGSYIDFSSSGTDWKGRILYDNSSNHMRFETGGTERVRINSAGAIKFNNYGAGTLVTDASGNVTVSSDITLAASLRAGLNVSGGGTITVNSGDYIKNSQRFIVLGNGRGSNFASNGYFDINIPTSGTITGVGGSSNKTATSDGVNLGAWEALYYILPIGNGNGSLAANFRVSKYTVDFDAPYNWVLLANHNGDNGAFYILGGKYILATGQSINTVIYNSRRIEFADKLTTARTINGVSFNGSANITVADSTKLPLSGGTMTGSIAMSNNNITGVNQLQINDPGEGVLFVGTTNVELYAIDDATDSIINFDNATEIRRDNVRLADVPYIAARSQQLMTNYNGLLGNNYNFPGFTFDGAEANYSPGSFKFVGSSGNSFTTEYMAVDTAYRYKMSLDAKTLNGVGRYYCMTLCYDVDQNLVQAPHHMYRANTSTTLAVALNPGDTTVTLAGTGSNWYNGGTAGVSTHLRSLIIWEYANSLGYTYPPETYSRLWYGNSWDPGDITGNVITLRVPWAGPAYPVGTRLSNGSSGGSYKYNVMSNRLLTTDWVQYSGVMDGVDLSGTNNSSKFPPGTAKIKMGFLMNYNNQNNDTLWITNFNVGIDLILSEGGTINKIAKFTTSSSIGDSLISDTGTNVGIGVSSPSQKLEVAGNIIASGSSYISAAYNSSNFMRMEGNSSGGALVGYDGGVNTTMIRSYGESYFNGGNVGIGTTSPAAKLDVYSAASFRADVATGNPLISIVNNTATSNTAGTATIKFTQANTQAGGKIVSARDGNYSSGATRTSNLQFYTSTAAYDTEKMRIGSNGNVGIGTTSPTDTLDVDGGIRLSTSGTIQGRSYPYTTNIGSGANATTTNITAGSTDKSEISLVGGDVGDRIEFKTNSTERMRIDASGNVGIGTTSPGAYKLNVAGGGRFSANVDFANNFGIRGIKTDNSAIVIARINSSNELVINENASTTVPTRIIGNHIALETTNFLGTAVEAVRVIDGGNVGIGTTSPATKLDVVGDLTVSGNQNFNGSYIYGDSKLLFQYSDTWLRINQSNNFSSGIYCGTGILRTDGIFQIGAGGSKFIVTAAGDVGIGVSSSPSSKLQVNGTITATTKNFLIDNPKTGGELQYSVIESDEHGVCVRGESDQEEIELPEEWEWLVHEDSVTVQLTSIDQVQHLFVLERNNIRVRVGGLVTNGQYSYVVYGTRKDVDPLEVNI